MECNNNSQRTVLFVNSRIGSKEEFRSNKHLARKHVSTVVRRRLRASYSARTGSKSRPLRPAQIADAPSHGNIDTTAIDYQPMYAHLPPLSGALVKKEVDSPQDVSLTTEYIINIMPRSYPTEELSAIFAAFCQHPIIYHSLNQVATIYRNGPHSTKPAYYGPRMLWHQSQSISHLRNVLGRLDSESLALALFAVITLVRSPFQPDHSDRDAPYVLPFAPHMPFANGLRAFVCRKKGQAHYNAMYALVDHAGGLEKLALPGLARMCALQDLIEAAAENSAPVFPNFWQASESMWNLPNSVRWELQDQAPDPAGSGFASLMPSLLPEVLTRSLVQLATVDRLMAIASRQRLNDRHYQVLFSARNECHHNILSIPRWAELSDVGKVQCSDVGEVQSSYLDYELCRNTAILYSTAVVFPMPPQCAWHSNLLETLRQLLQMPGIDQWRQSSERLAVWVLFVVCIAAYPTPHFDFFSRYLKEHLLNTKLVSFADVRVVVNQFIWSDSACELGASIVWDKLGFRRTFTAEQDNMSSVDG